MIHDISKSFHNNLIPDAFEIQIQRIVTVYKKSKEVQNNAVQHYQVSRQWLPIYAPSVAKSENGIGPRHSNTLDRGNLKNHIEA